MKSAWRAAPRPKYSAFSVDCDWRGRWTVRVGAGVRARGCYLAVAAARDGPRWGELVAPHTCCGGRGRSLSLAWARAWALLLSWVLIGPSKTALSKLDSGTISSQNGEKCASDPPVRALRAPLQITKANKPSRPRRARASGHWWIRCAFSPFWLELVPESRFETAVLEGPISTHERSGAHARAHASENLNGRVPRNRYAEQQVRKRN